MRWVLQDEGPPARTPIYVSGFLLAGFVLAFAWTRLGFFTPSCRFRDLSGWPCATCGTTRTIEALTHGQLISALSFNPLLCLALSLLCVWLVLSIAGLVRGKSRKLVFETGDARKLWIALGLAVLLNWAYLIFFDPS